MTSEMKLFILDLHNAIADFDNERLTGNGLRNEIAEIIADKLGSLEQGSYIHHVIRNKSYDTRKITPSRHQCDVQ